MPNEIKDLMTMKDEIEAESQEQKTVFREEPHREEPVSETKEERTETRSPVPKEKRKYFKYQNGRVIYMEPNKEERNLWDKLKEKVKTRVDAGEKKEPSSQKTLYTGIIIILAFLLTYMVLHAMMSKDEDRIYFPADTDNVVAMVPESEKADGPEVEVTTPADTAKNSEYVVELKEINTKEREKVRDYIAGISNRGAVVSHIDRAMTQKMSMYEKLEDKSDTNSLIVNSLAMSQEFLSSFKERSVRDSLKAVLEKYE